MGRAMQARVWGLLAGVAVVLVAMVALRPLLPIDETRYLSIAWEMHRSGDPVHLTMNGAPYTHKTPLLFVLINLVWLVTGVSEFAARLVGPACALAMVAGTAALARRFWPSLSGGAQGRDLAAALILCGFPVFLIYGSATMFDALLGLGVLGGVAALWRVGQGDAGRRPWVGFGLALAFGTYAKGPVILVHLLPLALTLPLWALVPPRPIAIAKGLGLAMVVALVIVAVWLVPTLATATPEFRAELLWTQTAARVTGGLAHDRPVWFLAGLVPVLLFPFGWSWGLWRGLGGQWRSDPAVRLCAIWALSSLVLFSLISGKQVHYLLPTFPAVALLFAASTGQRGSLAWLPLVGMAAGAAAVGFHIIPASGDLALFAPYWPLVMFAALCLLWALASLRLPLVIGHAATGVVVVLGLHLVVGATLLYPAYDGRRIAAVLAAGAPGGLAVTDTDYHAEFNFLARLTEPVAVPQTPADWTDWVRNHPLGLVFGETGASAPKSDPDLVLPYRGHKIGLWPAAAMSRE